MSHSKDTFYAERLGLDGMSHEEQRTYNNNVTAYMRGIDNWHTLPKEITDAFAKCKTEQDVHEVRKKYGLQQGKNGAYLNALTAAFDRVRGKHKRRA